MGKTSRSLLFVLAFAALAGVAVLVYAPGLNGVFVFDSVERVVRNDSLRIDSITAEQLVGAAYAGQASYPQRALSYISLALNYYFAGGHFNPFAFKFTNLVIHIINGLLVLVLARLIMTRWWELHSVASRGGSPAAIAVLSCFAAAMWVLHPIQLTSVLYVVQRMTSLAATCVLVGAIVYVIARLRLERGRPYSLLLIYVNVVICTGVGFFFKQNALLLPAFIAILEVFLFERRPLTSPCRRKLLVYFIVSLALPVLAAIVFIASGAAPGAASYELREFDALQRLLSQARVLFFYLSLLLLPDIRRFGLYHDDIAASAGILAPWTTLVAVIAWVVVVGLVIWGARRRAPWAFVVAWFLVGHAVESTVLPLELVHEHRNYVPSVAIWIGLAHYAGVAWNGAGRLRHVIPYAMAVWLTALAAVTYLRAASWRDPAVLMETLVRYHPQSYRAAIGYAFNSIPSSADLAIRFNAFRRAATLNPQVVSPLIQMSRIAKSLYNYLADRESVPEAGHTRAEITHIAVEDMVLMADTAHTARLLSAIDDHVTRRLQQQRPRTGNAVALIALVDCALDGRRECVDLRESATRWHLSALSNQRLPAHLRAALELSVAKLYTIAGDRDKAVLHARLAGRSAGDNLAYRLQEATLYALFGRWRELGSTLGEIEQRFPIRAQADSVYQDLRAQYDRRPTE